MGSPTGRVPSPPPPALISVRLTQGRVKRAPSPSPNSVRLAPGEGLQGGDPHPPTVYKQHPSRAVHGGGSRVLNPPAHLQSYRVRSCTSETVCPALSLACSSVSLPLSHSAYSAPLAAAAPASRASMRPRASAVARTAAAAAAWRSASLIITCCPREPAVPSAAFFLLPRADDLPERRELLLLGELVELCHGGRLEVKCAVRAEGVSRA